MAAAQFLVAESEYSNYENQSEQDWIGRDRFLIQGRNTREHSRAKCPRNPPLRLENHNADAISD
jgi:hypothetical protein